MKKKFLVVILGLILCVGMVGCTDTGGFKDHDEHSKLIGIEGEKDLYYYSTTHIVYITFYEGVGGQYGYSYGYMAPYYSESGKLCIYDTENKAIIEIGE
jgi:hypothetical protein